MKIKTLNAFLIISSLFVTISYMQEDSKATTKTAKSQQYILNLKIEDFSKTIDKSDLEDILTLVNNLFFALNYTIKKNQYDKNFETLLETKTSLLKQKILDVAKKNIKT